MARSKANSKGESISGYFNKLLDENPGWLNEKSNDVILARYRKDHNLGPDDAIPNNIRQGLSNVKSVRRRNDRKGKRRGRPPQGATPGGPPGLRKPAARPTLEVLEEQIDDCLSMAKRLDPEGLTDVIHLLRRARNEVVWKSGQP